MVDADRGDRGSDRTVGAGGHRRGRVVAGVVAACVVVAGATAAVVLRPSGNHGTQELPSATPDLAAGSDAPTPSGSPSGAARPGTAPRVVSWLSGAASGEASDGRYGTWRGEPITIGGTWDNGNSEQLQMYSICARGDWARWNRPLDVAIGAIDVRRGETWAKAAKGAYTARWRKNLLKIKQCWGSRDAALLYIRFAHEMNLAAMKWRVRGGEEASFVRAITLYSNLRYQILPRAKIVLCPNDGSETGKLNGLDIRKLWPGKDSRSRPVVNVYAADSYNMNPHVTTQTDFDQKINAEYPSGVPLGIEAHRRFAERMGVPFAIGEWGNNGDPRNLGGGGESPLYVRAFFQWAASHAGDVDHPVPGQLVYEIHFNLWKTYAFWPATRQPRTAAAYRALRWGQPPVPA